MLVVASDPDRPGHHAAAVEKAELVGMYAVGQAHVASQDRVVPAGHDEAGVPERLVAQDAVERGVRPLAPRADDRWPHDARARRKGAHDAADAVGEAPRVRAVVRPQADEYARGRDLRRDRTHHLQALRRGAAGAGVPRDLAFAE